MLSLSFQIFSQHHEKAQLGESPCWDPENDDLWWVDVSGKRLLKTNISSGETDVWELPEQPGFVVLTASGSPAIGMETGIFAFVPDTKPSYGASTGAFEKLVDFNQPCCRFNDATVDQRGRLWASTMALDAQAGRAAIHLITKEFSLETIVTKMSIPNGLAVDLERKRIFYSDSHSDIQTIWVKPIENDSSPAGEATHFASTKNLNGRPDGAALDQDGCYWIAGVDGSELYVFDLYGELHATIPVPFPAPTKICFSGHGKCLVTSKGLGEWGGYLARANMPREMTAGIVQPYWNPKI